MAAPVQLIVGLGNPGERYRRQRHNLGFMVVEELARRLEIDFQPGDASYEVAEKTGPDGSVVLLKPLTYMNLSGEAVAAWSRDSGVSVTGAPVVIPENGEDPENEDESSVEVVPEGLRPLVVCDDLSLPLGSLRLRPRGSSGGQNGLESLIDHLQGELFPRLRLGIAPRDREIDPAAWSDHVLADFETGEQETADDLVDHAATALEYWLVHGLEATVSRFNRRIRLEIDPPQ